jgi:hypothetical protein
MRSTNPKTDRRASIGDPAEAQDLSEFQSRLGLVSQPARKLLVHIATLAYHGRGQNRKIDTAYFPELHESCGLDVDAMYALLKELAQAHLIEIEDRYPFEDVRIAAMGSGGNVLFALSAFAESEGVSLRELLVDLRFDLLK